MAEDTTIADKPLADQIVQWIKDDIINGDVDQGEWIDDLFKYLGGHDS